MTLGRAALPRAAIARAALMLAIGASVFIADGSWRVPAKSAYSDDLGVWDGIIRSVDAQGMFVEVRYRYGRTELRRFDFGPHMRFSPVGSAPATAADLVAGKAIGMVVRREPYGPMRVVTVWLD